MSITFRCIHCKRRFSAGDEHAGKVVRCKVCGERMIIPDVGEGETDVYEFVEPLVPEETSGEGREPGADEFVTAATLPKRGGKPRKVKPPPKPSRWTLSTRQIGALALLAAALLGGGLLAYRRWPRTRVWITSTVDGKNVAVAVKLPRFPEPGPGVEVEPDVMFQEIRLPGGSEPGHSGQLWLYLPRGEHAEGSLPGVLVAESGGRMTHAAAPGGADRSRHVPFVRAGFAVLAYELDGALEGRSGAEGPGEDLRKSLAAHAGLVNAEIALEFLLAKVPQVDPGRIVAVGHGTAGTAAILLAENDSRLKGCAALAAPIDLEQWFGARAVEELRRAGAGDLFTSDSPRANEDRLACPLFLYHARDDPVVPVGQSEACAERLERLHKAVTLEVVPSGGHGAGLVQQAIPRVISWIEGLPGFKP